MIELREIATQNHLINPLSFIQSLSHANLDGIFAFNHNLDLSFWNEAMERITSQPYHAVIGKNFFDTLEYLKGSAIEEEIQHVLSGEKVRSPVMDFNVPPFRDPGLYQVYFLPMLGSKNEIIGAIGIVRDQHENKKIENQLYESEIRFESMANGAPVMLWMSGLDSQCYFFNQSWYDFTGRTFDQEVGVGWASGVHPVDFQKCMDTYLDAFNSREEFEMEYRMRRHDGVYRWILDRGRPRYRPNGEFAGFIGSCIDITDIKRAQEELEGALTKRDDFLSIASHELKTPLTSLCLQVQKLKYATSAALSEDKVRKTADISSRQILKLGYLVDTLLDVSRIRTGRLIIEPAPANLNQQIRDVISELRDSYKKGQILFEPQTEIQGVWDPNRISQVLQNLISNAIKYGRGKPIVIRSSIEDGRVKVEIIDQGVGIREEDFDRIFQRFERSVPSKNFGGLGLGLFIAKQIIDLHGGRITVESKINQGSTFTLRMPLRHDA